MKITWDLLRELEDTYGDSYFLINLQAFQENYSEFLQAFQSYYPNTNLAYSYKTNYSPKLCKLVNSYGGYAEVVSGMEFDLALRIGVPAEKIIFNGPYKRVSELEKALLAGSIVNLDSVYEMDLVEEIAGRHPETTLTLGIRCNFELEVDSRISRFGFDVEGEDFKHVIDKVNKLGNCKLGGLHCHFSTSDRSIESYAMRTKEMLRLSKKIFVDDHPQFLNLGGGFFGKMSEDLKKQFGYHVPNYQEYAEAIAPQFADSFSSHHLPELILEPGTAIVSNTMKFVAKVIEVKTVRSKTFAITSGSIHNIKPTLNSKNLPIQVYGNKSDYREPDENTTLDFVGYTCMETDYLHTGYKGSVYGGDYIVFDNVGAYTIVLKPPFIFPAPAIIAYDQKSGDVETIKRPENFSDIFSSFVF